MNRPWAAIAWLYCLLMLAGAANVAAFTRGTPIVTDSRIKTFVYNENDVYRILTYIGYQMNIEFGKKEHIQTISVGDRTGWQIIPSGNRLFIRAMEKESHTNMTIVTNKRAYQFDLYSAPPGKHGWDELVYVVRFYYPDEEQKRQLRSPIGRPTYSPMGGGVGGLSPMSGGGSFGAVMPPSMPPPAGANFGYNNFARTAGVAPPAMGRGMAFSTVARPAPGGAAFAAPPPMVNSPMVAMGSAARPNYNYSFTGDKALLPKQMFDDGRRTYLQYTPGRRVPRFFVVSADGREREIRLGYSNEYLTAPGVYSRMTLRQGNRYACIYNEMMPQL